MNVLIDSREKRKWVQQNCTRYSVCEWTIDPLTFEIVPWRITLLEEQDQVLYTLRWS